MRPAVFVSKDLIIKKSSSELIVIDPFPVLFLNKKPFQVKA